MADYNPGNIAQDVKDAIEQVKAGYVPPDVVGTTDEDGKVIERPNISVEVAGVPETGTYIRSEAETPAVSLVK